MSEIILPEHRVTRRIDPEQMLNDLVERKVQEILAEHQAAGLHSLFPGNARLVTDALKRLQTVPEQQKSRRYYEKYGCRICADRERGHASLGLCQRCYGREVRREKTLRTEFAKPPEIDPATLPADRIALAKAALPGPLPGPEYIDGLPGFIDRRATAREALRPRKPAFKTPRIRIKGGKNRPITPEQAERFIAAADTPLQRTIVALTYSTGCWLTELSALRIEDITWGQPPTISITESRGPERIAPLNPGLAGVSWRAKVRIHLREPTDAARMARRMHSETAQREPRMLVPILARAG